MQAQPFSVTRDWTWEDYSPHYQALLDAELTAANLSAWIADWDALFGTVNEAYFSTQFEYDLNTNDEDATKAIKRFNEEIVPQVNKHQFHMKQKLLESGLVPDGLEVTLRQMRLKNEVFREENLPLMVELNELARQYGQIVGSQSLEWNGEEKTVVQMKKLNAIRDRDLREKAWRTTAERQLADRESINDIWTQLMKVRKQVYQNTDEPDFRAFTWKAMARLDYAPQDSLAFCDAIEQEVVPVLARLRERRRQRLGLDTLRPWDATIEPHDVAPPLYEHAIGEVYQDADELIARCASVFNQIDPEIGGLFQTMRDNDWLNLDNTRGKSPGAYCIPLPVSNGAKLFGNAAKSAPDVSMVLHESGHGFHCFYMSSQPYIEDFWGVPIEFAEVASTAMELLAIPYLTKDKGGFFTEEDLTYYILDTLVSNLERLPYIAVIVSFQHWAYANHDLATDPVECDKKWYELWMRFSPNVDYSGLEDWVSTGWHRKGHLYGAPFYYIEYGLAFLGAVQIWDNARKDQAKALEAYRAALKAGNTVGLGELFELAGAKFAFDAETIGKAMQLLESEINRLDAFITQRV